jgi:iron complex transport system substrate-binding protein
MAVTDRTFLGQLAREAGLDNIAADLPGNYPIISREEILRRGPEIIIGMTDTAPTLQALASAFPEWKGLRAVRSKSVYRIDPDLLTRPSARVIVALDTLAHIARGSAALN